MTESSSYQKGFNEGYIITKHLPGLADKLSEVKSETSRMEGFRDGRDEFIHEKAKERLPQWLNKGIAKKDKGESQDKGKEIDRE